MIRRSCISIMGHNTTVDQYKYNNGTKPTTITHKLTINVKSYRTKKLLRETHQHR